MVRFTPFIISLLYVADLDALRLVHEQCEEAVARKHEERKKTVWNEVEELLSTSDSHDELVAFDELRKLENYLCEKQYPAELTKSMYIS